MQKLQATLPLDHVAVAVPSIDEHRAYYESLTGEICSPPLTIASQGVRVAFVGMIELLEPTAPDTTVGRFLARRGAGLHHIAYRTPDIERELERASAQGIRLIDEVPRAGAHGRVAFLHPSSTGGVLIELVQREA
ncbi:MAG: methylmalonyl-CoA epimerase [Gemmatimonadota bacterium]